MASNRSTPGAALPNVRAKSLAKELGGHVLHKRLQDHEYEIKSHEHLSTLQHDFDYLLTACMRDLDTRAFRQKKPWAMLEFQECPAMQGEGKKIRVMLATPPDRQATDATRVLTAVEMKPAEQEVVESEIAEEEVVTVAAAQ
ncbi:MAG: hypothetical protein SGPRY_001408, partial [Prymnesium sp.]